jgi:CRISPR-associated protein Cas1
MITAPDFSKKRIAFISTASLGECDFSFRNENIVIANGDGAKEKIPLQLLAAVFLHGEATLTTKLIANCSRHGVSLFLLDRSLRTYASFCPYAEGNYLLRERQYALSDTENLGIARKIVSNKIRNQLALLRSVGIEEISGKNLLERKREWAEKVIGATDMATLRGIEGTAGKLFFREYFGTIGWYRRVPRGKIDENNILLDMGYSYLFHFTDSLLRLFGFDTYKGAYHQLFFQRKSLACDMMEPFRCIVDRALLKMHTLNRFDADDFFVKNGNYGLKYTSSSHYSKIFLEEILKQKMEVYEFVRGFYYRVLNGNEDAFNAFIIR